MEFKRALQFAMVNFNRNKQTAIAAIFVLSLVIAVVTTIFFMHGATNYLVQTIQEKIDVSAYFNVDTPEDKILTIRSEILKEVPGVKSVEYISRDAALTDFNEKHKDNPVFSQALDEVGDNPFLPSINIVTSGDGSDYEKVANLLEQDKYKDSINKVDFYQKKDIIEKVFAITKGINRFGVFGAFLMIVIAVLVVFNTMKLIITLAQEEISTMRVMGANNWFIKAPFIMEGALFGVVAFIICFVITLLVSYFLSHFISVLVPGFNVFKYFVSNFFGIVLLQLLFSVGLGALASLVVVNKYLKV